MSALTPVALTFSGTTFLTSGVKVGDKFVVKTLTNPAFAAANVANYTGANASNANNPLKLFKTGSAGSGVPLDYDAIYISEVTSELALKVVPYKNGIALNDSTQVAQYDVALLATDSLTYDIIHLLSKDEQATLIANTAKSYGSKRVLYVWPPEADWDGNGSMVNGSAIAAATAAAMSAYPAQQSFTNLGFGGPYELKYSNNYFTPSQLDKMSDAGVFVLVQDAKGGQVYARHQKTTSSVSIQEQEFSITKTVDKLSLDLSSLVKPFIGKFNINQDLLTQLDDVLKQYLFKAKTDKAPYCGSLIIDYSQLVLRANLEGQNQDLPVGTIEIAVTVEVGYPANFINVKLYVK